MRLLITGASGQLGAYLLRELRGTTDTVIAWSGTNAQTLFGYPVEPVNLANGGQLAEAFNRARPTAVIHAAAVASIAACHRDPHHAWNVNVQGSAHLAGLAADAGARFAFVSTDLVFDGTKGGAYFEEDAPAPLSIYGKTKRAAEEAILPRPNTVVVRLSLLFGPTLTDRSAFFDGQVAALRNGQPIPCFVDEWRSPLDYATAARALLALARSNYRGLLHVGGPERLSRCEMAYKVAAALHVSPDSIEPVGQVALAASEPRPRDVTLGAVRWRAQFPEQPWPTMEQALRDMFV
jgi:dTDP-4-dehydrorhamnose reductase